MIIGTIILMITVFLVYRYKCSKPAPETYQPPSLVNPTFQATAPPSAVTPPSTSPQQVFVKVHHLDPEDHQGLHPTSKHPEEGEGYWKRYLIKEEIDQAISCFN